MFDKRSNEHFKDLRDRLYDRSGQSDIVRRTDIQQNNKSSIPSAAKTDILPPRPTPLDEPVVPPLPSVPEVSFFRRHRYKFISVGVLFFVLSVLLSSVYMLFGGNTVSGSNISIGITGPFTIGGGETMPIQIGVTNNNSIGIAAATIVVEYPSGTRSDEGEGKELFTERIPVSSSISSGETRNIPLRVRVFGEENQESEIKVSIEYRVEGSSATFYKEAEPLRFKISHAPVVIKVEAEKNISADQETRVKLIVTSNSSSPLYDLAVKAEYPSSFDFVRADPTPSSGRNIWRISELAPEASTTIDLYGKFAGSAGEEYVLKFVAGISSNREPNSLSSVLAVSNTEFSLEDPFLSTKVTINGQENETISVSPGSQTNVVIDLTNNSRSTVHNASISVSLTGNAISDSNVSVSGGYYDSNTRKVYFSSGTSNDLERLNSGDTRKFSFSFRTAAGNISSPQVLLEVSAAGRRLAETNAREEITGTLKRTIKVAGELNTSGQIADVVSGPIPPVVGKATGYRLELSAGNSGNPVTGAVVTATLPTYIDWAGDTSGSGVWNYDQTSRTLEWRAGSIPSGAVVKGTFGISILPSASLVGKNPVLIDNIQLRADDSFTGTVLRASGGSVSAEISGQSGSGIVKEN